MIEQHDVSLTGLGGQLAGTMLFRLSEHQVICMCDDHALLYERWVPGSRISGWKYKRLEQTIQLSGEVALSWHEAEHFWCDVDAINLERRKEVLDPTTEAMRELQRLAPVEEAMKRAVEGAGVPRDPAANQARIKAIVEQWRISSNSEPPRTTPAAGAIKASSQGPLITEVKLPAVGDWHRAETLRLLRQWRGLARSGETLVDAPGDRERTNGFGMPLDVVLVQVSPRGLD